MVDDVLFSEWLNEQMRRKQWSQAHLARVSGLAPSTIYKVLNSKIKHPSLSSCQAIANAFGISNDTVFRAAKISSIEPEFPEQKDLNMVVAQLPERDRQEILAIARVKLEFNKKGYADVD
jgi:transcriptional regulator with XRE-family HTH domain